MGLIILVFIILLIFCAIISKKDNVPEICDPKEESYTLDELMLFKHQSSNKH